MKHEVFFLGKTKDTFIAKGIAEYSARLQHYTRLSLTVLKEKKITGLADAAAIEGEGDVFLQALPAGSVLVALDIGGRQISSLQFAEMITGWEQAGIKTIGYVIGGYLGLSRRVTDKADLCLSLSRMTFTHDMARLLLLEQIYRAYTIKAGEKYHK